MTLPRTPDRLPDEMAIAIGHAVSGFGYLEETLKRAIFSISRKGLGEDADETALQQWLQRMEDITDDSLGTLIDSFIAAIKPIRLENREDFSGELRELRVKRNLLCHASWRKGLREGYWHPTFINTKGERYPDEMTAVDIKKIHQNTLKTIHRVVAIMRATGIEGELAGDDNN